MGCKGCGPTRAEPKPKKLASDYLVEPGEPTALSKRAPVEPAKADALLTKMRVELCHRCGEVVLDADGNPTDQRLAGQWNSKLHCGNPTDERTATDPARFGWGCPVEDRAIEDDAVCPRKKWGPGRNFYDTALPIIPIERGETLPGVIDFIGPTRTPEGVNDCSGIGDVMVQGVVAQAVQRFNKARGLRVRFITVAARLKWAKMVCPDLEVLALDDATRVPGEFTQHSAPLRLLELDASCKMLGQNRHQFIAQQFGIPHAEVEQWDVPLDEAKLAEADEYLSIPKKAGRPVVCVSPFANSSSRQWPLRHWIELIDKLKKELKVAVFITASPGDAERLGKGKAFPTRKFTSTDPQLVAAMLSRCDLVLGNDSGMVHVAGLLRRPAIAICAPTLGSVAFGGWPTVSHIQADGPCSGCLWFQDGGWKPWCTYGCDQLADIKPAMVMPRVDEILRETGVL